MEITKVIFSFVSLWFFSSCCTTKLTENFVPVLVMDTSTCEVALETFNFRDGKILNEVKPSHDNLVTFPEDYQPHYAKSCPDSYEETLVDVYYLIDDVRDSLIVNSEYFEETNKFAKVLKLGREYRLNEVKELEIMGTANRVFTSIEDLLSSSNFDDLMDSEVDANIIIASSLNLIDHSEGVAANRTYKDQKVWYFKSYSSLLNYIGAEEYLDPFIMIHESMHDYPELDHITDCCKHIFSDVVGPVSVYNDFSCLSQLFNFEDQLNSSSWRCTQGNVIEVRPDCVSFTNDIDDLNIDVVLNRTVLAWPSLVQNSFTCQSVFNDEVLEFINSIVDLDDPQSSSSFRISQPLALNLSSEDSMSFSPNSVLLSGMTNFKQQFFKTDTLIPENDTYLNPCYRDSNFGEAEQLRVLAWTWINSGCSVVPSIAKAYVQFNFNQIPLNIRVDSASLELTTGEFIAERNCESGPNNSVIRVISEPWDEDSLSLNDSIGVNNIIIGSFPATCTGGVIKTNMTEYVQDVIASITDPLGFEISLQEESRYRGFTIYSKESQFPPRLIVHYYDEEEYYNRVIGAMLNHGEIDYLFADAVSMSYLNKLLEMTTLKIYNDDILSAIYQDYDNALAENSMIPQRVFDRSWFVNRQLNYFRGKMRDNILKMMAYKSITLPLEETLAQDSLLSLNPINSFNDHFNFYRQYYSSIIN